MKKDKLNSCGIIGSGRVGSALARALSGPGRLDWIVARSDRSMSRAKEIPGSYVIIRKISEIVNLPDILIIAVADNSIKDVSDDLSRMFNTGLKDKLVIHCSGIVGVDALDSCKATGALTASAHPYQTFYYPEAGILDNIAWGVESDGGYDTVSEFIKSIGGKPHNLGRMTPGSRALYHASAVAVSNFMTIIIDLSRQLASLSGLPVKEFIRPIAETTLKNNIASLDTGDYPLTGPISRGDSRAFDHQLQAMKQHPQLQNIFSLLSLATAEDAALKGVITLEKLEEIRQLTVAR